MKHHRTWKLGACIAALSLALTACGGTDDPSANDTDEATSDADEATDGSDEAVDDAESDDDPAAAESDDDSADGGLTETRGPNGEEPTPSSEVTLTAEQEAAVAEGGFSAALLWHTSSDFVNAVSAGAADTFEDLGVEVIATTDAGFDSAQQQADVETVMARQPSTILTLPVDPVSAAQAYQPALDAGTDIVVLSNPPEGFEHGTDYVGLVTDDLFQMGALAAEQLAEALDGEGQIAWIYHDADYYVTNQRDEAFKTVIERDYPDIEIVAEEPLADPARGEEIGSALLTQNPDLDGVYVTWAEPAEGVLSALRSAGRDDVSVVTLDLSETLALDMVQGGNVVAMVADEAYELGAAMARVAALGLLDEEAPAFTVAPALAVTADNVVDGWQASLNRDPPESVVEALDD